MRVAVIGLGVEGRSSLEYWQALGHDITVCDQNTELELPHGIDGRLGPDYLSNLDQFDLVVRTAGLNPQKIIDANSPTIAEKITSATNEFYRVCPSKNIIGVTGTKGKGTTSTLIAKVLEAAGKTVHLGGNIGISPLDMLRDVQPDDWVVLEQSSFQLCDQKYSPRIATCLMVVPEHLDWHADLEEYIEAKQQLFRWQEHEDKAYFNRASQHSKEIAGVSMGEKDSYEVPSPGAEPTETTGAYVKDDVIYMNNVAVCHVDDVKLLGRHNLENVCAALVTTWDLINQDATVFKQVVSQFSGLPHRLELVREVDGVGYYDDSFGTTPETAMVAIQSFEAPKVVILGGSDKGADYTSLAHVVAANNVKTVIAIGETGPAIAETLQSAGFENTIEGADNMPGIIKQAREITQPGDVVLLSTACASFDMFKNYKERGEHFYSAVRALQATS